MRILVFNQNNVYQFIFGSVGLLFIFLLVLIIKQKRRTLSVDTYNILEEKFISVLLAIWIYNIFNLPYALLVWFLVYLIVLIIEKKGHAIRCINTLYKISRETMLRKQVRLYEDIHIPIQGDGFIDTIKLVRLKRRHVAKKLLDSNIRLNSHWKKSYISIQTFLLGVFIFGCGEIIRETSFVEPTSFIEALIENVVVAFSVLYGIFPIAHYLGIKWEKGFFVGTEVFFWIHYSLFSIVILGIAIAISFNVF